MKWTTVYKECWNRWTLRRRILTIMLVVALFISLVGAVVFGLSARWMNSTAARYAQSMAHNVSEPVRAGFYQQNMCLYSSMAAAQAAYLDGQQAQVGKEALLEMACEYGEKTFQDSWPLDGVCFLWLDGAIHTDGDADVLPVMEKMLGEVCGMTDVPAYVASHPREWLFTQEEDGHFLTWAEFGEHGRIGMLIPASECYDLMMALAGLLAEETAVATEGIRSATMRIVLIALVVVAAALALLLLAVGRLARMIAAPVEQEQARYASELKQAELEKQLLADLDRKKTEFLANISHELKTPLTVVSSYAQSSALGLAEIPEAEKEARAMRMIVTEVNRMALLVNQLLDVTRIDEGRLVLNRKPLQIDEVVKRTLDTYAPILQQNGNRLRFHRVYDLPELEADEVRIQQVLVNLLSNAAQHTRDGVITVGMARIPGGVEICIADTGDGIAPDRLPHLFERFSESKTRASHDTGTGLGLFLCKHFVEAHGGTIALESEQGTGTTVRFTLMESLRELKQEK